MKTNYDRLDNCEGYHVGDRMWLYRPTRRKRKSSKLKSSWEGPYKVVTRINGVLYRIQWHPGSMLMVVRLDWLVTYQGTLGMRGPKEGAAGAVGE
jgi:hypothetical protein